MNTTLKLSKFVTIVGLTLGLAAGTAMAAPAGAHQHDHDHAGGATALMLNDGAKWAIDAPLARAMANIRNAVHAELDEIHADKLPKKNYRALAKKISGEVAYMVENCHLEPEADAQLHLIIADLIEGVAAMEGETAHGSPRDGAVKVVGALDDYATYFDDPRFEPIRH
jgi:hypothetical protein